MPMQTHSYVMYVVPMRTKGVHSRQKLFQAVFQLLQSLGESTTVSLSKLAQSERVGFFA